MEELLRMEHISKKFGDFYANHDINLSIKKGEVHTLLGENGAGKSTLMNILIGLYQPTDGEIYFNGEKQVIHSPSKAVSLGIGMVHQHFMLVEAMTVFDNIILGEKKSTGIFIDRNARRKEIEELSDRYGLNIELDKLITEISVGAQQRVEILKVLYQGAELLILDEPTATLTDQEVANLFEIIRKLVSEGKSIIFISHKMREVMSISDRITILRHGETVKTLECKDTNASELANLMIGKEHKPDSYEKKHSTIEKSISLVNVSYNSSDKHNGLNDVTLSIKPGEVLGIAGVDGNGQTQLAQLLAGVIKPDKGEYYRASSRVTVFDPADFIRSGVAHIPEDRNLQGLIGDMSIADNLVLKRTSDPEFSKGKGFWINKGKIKDYAGEMCEKYDVRSTGISQEVKSLSGGNQQKVILARELETDASLLIAVHPTRGLDIGAASFVHDRMIEARDKGIAIVMISADFDEVLTMSDRIAVMFEGRIMGIYDGANPPIEAISLAMTGEEAGNE